MLTALLCRQCIPACLQRRTMRTRTAASTCPAPAAEPVVRRPVRVGPPAEADEVRERRPVRREQRGGQVRPEPLDGGRPTVVQAGSASPSLVGVCPSG